MIVILRLQVFMFAIPTNYESYVLFLFGTKKE